MASRTFIIGLGTPAATATITLIGTASAGTPGALGTLTHPDSANFPVVTYESNPDRVFNLDNEALISQFTSTIVTLADRKVVQFDGNLADTLVTETWTGSGQIAAMTAAFFRQLYELYVNPPVFDPISQTYIQWAPAYRSTKVYNVQITDLSVGGGPGSEPAQRFNVSDQIIPGGREDGGDTMHGLDAILPSGVVAGLVDLSVSLQMKIISEV